MSPQDNIRDGSDIDVGFGSKQALQNRKNAKPTDVLSFRQACVRFLSATTSKIIERSPLKYPATKMISSLSPSLILKSKEEALANFENLLDLLIQLKLVSFSSADNAKNEFKLFTSNETVRCLLEQYSPEMRLDVLYVQIHESKNGILPNFMKVVKLCLILSDGNASVEAGFSINDGLLVENMKNELLWLEGLWWIM